MSQKSGRDWSRQARSRQKLQEAGNYPSQLKLTDYWQVLNELELLLRKNASLSDFINNSLHHTSFNESETIGPLLQKVLKNIERNHGKAPKQRRHDSIVKLFATALYIFSGSMTYEFIHRNLPEALPSLRTVEAIVQSQYSHIEEGVFRFDEAVEHLHKYNLPFVVSVAEDATRIVKRVEYDPATNRCVGFVIP